MRWFAPVSDFGIVPTLQLIVDNFNASQTTISLTLEAVDATSSTQFLQDDILAGHAPMLLRSLFESTTYPSTARQRMVPRARSIAVSEPHGGSWHG